ncbi:Late competence protein ComGG [Streptococcus infantarius subsp. infantarius]|nr:Late competence protein ComGG [Streptococcus infantarius subsp. infantarius]MCO4482420.1 Late competence protein ComGG [Streptococcus infantarius subsp. infantarius]MCO4498552.1 Late competence protein ComGG [Streptococcus infantarius subsp. infantarius]
MFTLLRRQVKAGILLYALLMAAIFALLLQFYLGRVVASERQHQAQIKSAQAYLMAEMSKYLADEESGQCQFDKGTVSYHYKDKLLVETVMLDSKEEFQYTFYLPKKEKQALEKETH